MLMIWNIRFQVGEKNHARSLSCEKKCEWTTAWNQHPSGWFSPRYFPWVWRIKWVFPTKKHFFRGRLHVYHPRVVSLLQTGGKSGTFRSRMNTSRVGLVSFIGMQQKGWDCDNATPPKKKRATEAALNEKLAERKDSPFCFFFSGQNVWLSQIWWCILGSEMTTTMDEFDRTEDMHVGKIGTSRSVELRDFAGAIDEWLRVFFCDPGQILKFGAVGWDVMNS